MLPARLVLVENMPRTASGKIDRAALPLPGCKRPMLAHPYVAPETELEKQLAAIWAEVLGLEQVGRHDPFPELGGDSLLAVLVIPHNRVLFPFIRQRLAEQVFRESYFLGGSDLPNEVSAKTAEMAARVRRSQEVLNRGGAVWIAGDGDFGTVRYSLPFYGRQLPFRAGAAVLAVRAGAPLIAVFPSMDRQGGLSIEFAAPLAPLPQDSLNLQIHDLLQQYAELYIDRWPQMLPHLSANLLWDRFVHLPLTEIMGK